MSIDRKELEALLTIAKLSQNLKAATTLDSDRISTALTMKLSHHFDPESDMRDELEDLHAAANEHVREAIKAYLGDHHNIDIFKKEIDENPDFSNSIHTGMRVLESVTDLIRYIDESEPDDDAKEFAAQCIQVFTNINSMLLEQDVVPLIKRGIYSEDITSAIAVWNNNFEDKAGDEAFWQLELSSRKGILERLIGGHALFLMREFHVGITDTEGKGSKRTDFAVIDSLNKNLSLIEIKTPNTNLLGSEYRSTYPLSREISGTISQVLNQKNEIIKNFYYKVRQSKDEFEVFSPRCFIIAGNLESLNKEEEKLKAFELQRQAVSAHVTIVTFDELYHQFSTFNQI